MNTNRNQLLQSACAPLFESLETRTLYAVYVVDTQADTGAGSFRAAITKSNNSVNVRDTIEFRIPSFVGESLTIKPQTKLPTINDPVTITGKTQNGYTDRPLIQISGNECDQPFANGLVIATKNTLVVGLGIDRFDKGAGIRIVGNNNGVHECYLGLWFVSGTDRLSNKWGVKIVDGSGNVIGENGSYLGNKISGNISDGVQITGVSSYNSIKGNFIGTDRSGGVAAANNGNGVMVGLGVINTFITKNTISGNKLNGVLINGGHETTVLKNNIGVFAGGGGSLGNKQNGIRVDAGGSRNTIGTVAEPNVIAWNTEDGICIAGGTKNKIRGNQIRNNGQLGIDLGNDGITLNDTGDGDDGANKLLNYPLISSASWDGTKTTLNVAFRAKPNKTYTYDVYSNFVPDSNNFGEGAKHEFKFTVDTNGSGVYQATKVVNNDLPNSFLSATLTDADGNTSEFSPVEHVANNKPGVPTLSISDQGFTETNSDKIYQKYAYLSKPLNDVFVYEWNPANGTAQRGPDFSINGSTSFAPGETQDSFPIEIGGDTIAEALEESFFIYISPVNPAAVKILNPKVTITIRDNDNTLPSAGDDFAETDYRDPVTIDVLADDHDADGDSLQLFSVEDPAHGTAEIVNGKLKYTPDADFIGYENLFKYRVLDQRGGSKTANVLVLVNPPSHIAKIEREGPPTVWDLKVTGTGGSDQIEVTKVGATQGKVKVKLNGTDKGTFSFSGRVIVDGLGGNDKIKIDHAITRAAWLIGGAGKDTLGGGGGSDALFAEDGEQDQLDGGPGIDLYFKDNLDFEQAVT